MHIAHLVLFALGAKQVFNLSEGDDPQTEEEFLLIQYESPTVITWQQYQQQYSITEQKVGLRQLRAYRDKLLRDTDWVMTVDNFETLQNKDEWIAYRKTLRNLPVNPPPFKWKNQDLDFKNMDMPIKPPVVRISTDNVIQ